MSATGVVNLVIIADARNYIQHWFKTNKVKAKDAEVDANLINTLYLDYDEDYRMFKASTQSRMTPVNEKKLLYAFTEYIDTTSESERASFIKTYTGHPENLSLLLTWIKAVTGTEDKNVIAVMAHWLWMIKRKANKLKVKHHIMPVIFSSDQGTGKTEAIKALINPLSQFRLLMNTDAIGDPKLFESMGRNFIVFFDEMQGIERADLNVLKNQITAEFNSYRKMYTHSVAQTPMNCSFIGASNRPISEMIHDTTGMRRFFEIASLSKCDWDAINNLDYEALWKGIDETKADGYLAGAQLASVQEVQKSLVASDDFEEYLRENYIRPEVGTIPADRSATMVYLDYCEWCMRSGVRKPLSRTWFTTKLKNRGIKHFKIRETLYFKINSNALQYRNEGQNVLKSTNN